MARWDLCSVEYVTEVTSVLAFYFLTRKYLWDLASVCGICCPAVFLYGFFFFFSPPSLGSHMSWTSFPRAGQGRALAGSSVFFFNCGLLDQPGFQVGSWATPDGYQSVQTPPVAIRDADGGGLPLKRHFKRWSFPHHCGSSLLHWCRSVLHFFASAVMRLLLRLQV